MGPLGWSVLLCLLMVTAVFMELLTASFGGFTLAALGAMALGIVQAFKYSPSFGYLMTAVNLVLFPVSLVVTLKLFRHSPLRLNAEIKGDIPAADEEVDAKADEKTARMLGREGKTMTDLRPAGLALFNNERLDVVSDGRYVEKGKLVRILRKEGVHFIVEPVEEDE